MSEVNEISSSLTEHEIAKFLVSAVLNCEIAANTQYELNAFGMTKFAEKIV